MKKKLLLISLVYFCLFIIAGCDTENPTNPPTGGNATSGAMRLYTTDGGLTWDKVFLADYRDITGISSFDAEYDLSIIAKPKADPSKDYLLKTIGGGNNLVVGYNGTRNPVDITNGMISRQGFAIGDEGLILMTTNNGFSWTEQGNAIEDFKAIDFDNYLTGIIIPVNMQDSIYVTTSGGVSWGFKAPVDPGNMVTDIQLLDASTAIVCGYNGKIYRTTDTGNSWEVIPSTTTDNLTCVNFFGSTGIIGGDQGTLLLTTDSGLNWTDVSGWTNSSIVKVYLDISAYWAITTHYILKSTDLGLTWTIVYDNSDHYLSDLIFFGDEGYVVGQKYPY